MTAAREQLFETLCDRIAGIAGEGLTTIAIDGVDGAGKTMFAAAPEIVSYARKP